MESKSTDRGLFGWLFNRDYFRSLRHWRWDVFGCFCLAAAVTPADPYSLLIVAIPLTAAWMLIRYAIASHVSTVDGE